MSEEQQATGIESEVIDALYDKYVEFLEDYELSLDNSLDNMLFDFFVEGFVTAYEEIQEQAEAELEYLAEAEEES